MPTVITRIPNANWRVRLSGSRDYQTRTAGRIEAASSQVKRWRRRGYLKRVYGTYVALYRRTRRHCTAVKCIPKPSASVTTLWLPVFIIQPEQRRPGLLASPLLVEPSRPQGFFYIRDRSAANVAPRIRTGSPFKYAQELSLHLHFFFSSFCILRDPGCSSSVFDTRAFEFTSFLTSKREHQVQFSLLRFKRAIFGRSV